MADGGAPKRRGARDSLPPPYPTISTRLQASATESSLFGDVGLVGIPHNFHLPMKRGI